MANIEYSIFNSLNGWTAVNLAPSGGNVAAIGGEGVIDRTGAGTNYDDMGMYRTNAVTAAIGHVIYIDVKLSAVTLGSGSHGLILLKDATGIDRSAGGTFQVGTYLQGVNPTRFTTWDGSAAGGSTLNMAANTWYTVRFTIDGSGDCQVDAKLQAGISYTNIGTLTGITVAGANIRVAAQYRNNDELMYLDNYFYTNDGEIGPIGGYLSNPSSIADSIFNKRRGTK